MTTQNNGRRIEAVVRFPRGGKGACRDRCAVTMSLKFGSPEILRVEPVDGAIKRLDVGGALSAAELLNVARLLKCIRNLKRYTKEQTGALEEYFSELVSAKPIEDEINRAIVSEDEIADAASPALANVRRKMKNTGAKIKDSLDSMVRSGHYQKFLMDNIVTMRNNRYVVPVKAEHRSEVPGIVHDMVRLRQHGFYRAVERCKRQ